MSICTKLQNKEHVTEALYRARFKFPGHQQIPSQRRRPFSSLMQMNLKTWSLRSSSWLMSYAVRYFLNPGPLDKWWVLHS
jgi:hypothetical protein